MRVEVISIGDELLLGQTVNTNASWIGQNLSLIGAEVIHGSVIRDNKTEIIDTLTSALAKADVVIITGGLGPTQDDITKSTLSEFFKTELILNNEVLERVKSFFVARGKEMLDVNIRQAFLPKSAIVLRNDMGTASGMWFEHDGKVVISLPGVPYEMKHIIQERVMERLQKQFNSEKAFHQTIQLQGIGESYFADGIKELEATLSEESIKIAYLPSTSLLRLRFSCKDTINNKRLIGEAIKKIKSEFRNHFVGDDRKTLSEVVGELLIQQNAKLSTVESCTGGAISKEIVSVSGSSEYFEGAIVSYSNRIKNELVGVSLKSLENFGAVSQEVVEEMATFGRLKMKSDYCISVSGIAGPNGGSEVKKVGLVWIAIASADGVEARSFQFGDNRERNIISTVLTALNLLRCRLLPINKEKS